MKTIGGGTVRYVDVSLLPCPEDPTLVGQCRTRATLELLDGDRVTQTFTLLEGDQLLIADGAVVAPGTRLIADGPLRAVRADIAPGVEAKVHWTEDLKELDDDVTGLAGARFPPGVFATGLRLGDPSDDTILSDDKRWAENLTPLVRSGAIVRRGDRLALERRPWYGKLCTSLPLLRAFLDARRLADPQMRAAVVAPCDGTVDAIDTHSVTIRMSDGQCIRVRLCAAYARVRIGDPVRAGDALTGDERSHHALLHILGEDALADHMLHELASILGASVPRIYWSLVLRAMLAWRRIRDPGDTGLARGAVISRDQLDEHQRATRDRGGTLATAAPALRGIGSIARDRRQAQRRD